MNKLLRSLTAVAVAIVTVASVAYATDAGTAGRPRPARKPMQLTIGQPTVQPKLIGTSDDNYATINEEIYATIDDWQSIGNGRYTDGFVAWTVGDTGYEMDAWAVEIEESAAHPGLFRLKNPYANCTYATQYGEVDLTQDYYMIVDATTADQVYVPLFDTGVNPWSYGECYGQSDQGAGFGTYDEAAKTITFPAFGLKSRLDEGSWYSCNNDQNCKIYLPGALDYTAQLTAGEMCGVTDATATLTTGADVTYVKAAFGTYGNATDFEQKTPADGTLDLSYTMSDPGKYELTVQYYNAEDSLLTTISTFFFNIDDQEGQWKSLGTTSMTEPFFYSFLGTDYPASTYEVELEENIATPGYYRIVNPMANYAGAAASYNSHDLTSHNHYIYIHAEDPGQVYLEESPIGFDVGYGAMGVSPVSGQYGSLDKGIITIPSGAGALWCRDWYNGYNMAFTANFEVTIPNEHTVTVKSAYEGAGTVAITDPATEGTSVTTKASSVTITATPGENAKFLFWSDAEGNEVSTEATYTFHGSVDAEFTAHFGYDVVWAATDGGSATVTTEGTNVISGQTYEAGTVIDITATCDENYVLSAVLLNGRFLNDTDGIYTFTVSARSVVQVMFSPVQYTLTLVTKGNGSIIVADNLSSSDGPDGSIKTNGSNIDAGGDLFLFLTPGEGDDVESLVYTNGNNEATDATADAAEGVWENEAGQRIVLISPVEGNVSINAVFTGEDAAIGTVTADSDDVAPCEFYTLQGVKISASRLAPGIYVMRQGSKTSKVLIAE